MSMPSAHGFGGWSVLDRIIRSQPDDMWAYRKLAVSERGGPVPNRRNGPALHWPEAQGRRAQIVCFCGIRLAHPRWLDPPGPDL
jgi:hypothetical protein